MPSIAKPLEIATKPLDHLANLANKVLGEEDKDGLSKNQLRKKEREDQRREKAAARDAEAEELEQAWLDEEERAIREESDEQRERYGPVERAPAATHAADRALLSSVTTSDVGKTIVFRARMHTMRVKSAALAFCVFRQQGITIQGVLETKNGFTEHMLRWIHRIRVESIVLVTGEVQKPPFAVIGATLHDVELKIHSLHLIAAATVPVPFDVYHSELVPRESMEQAELDLGSDDEMNSIGSDNEDENESTAEDSLGPSQAAHQDNLPQSAKAARKEHHQHLEKIGVDMKEHEEYHRAIKVPTISDRTRLAHRVIDLRTSVAQSVFRIQSGVCSLFRGYLDERGFIEMHTPKLQGGATESGASVFSVQYFGRPAFLAQSPQLAKQLCMSADFERVYEIGPVFRAENSNTPRHLTEYTGLDIEMTFDRDYHEVMHLIDGLIKHMLKGVHERFEHQLDIIRHHFPAEKFVWLEETPVIAFKDGIKLLHESGWEDASEDEDLSTAAEKRLGALVREKYGTDYYILDKFPTSARPFYTMPDKDDARFSNSFDIFLRGQEILSGGQRIHDATQLEESMRAKGVRPESLAEYMDGFRWGAPPHAGCGFGLERIVFLLLNLGNIRHASLFPRDPKSLPLQPDLGDPLRHPEANTLEPAWSRHRAVGTDADMPDLEKLIANYGDAPNTAWLDKRYEIWRHSETGAAVGFSRINKYVIIMGDPLCDHSQLEKVAGAFLKFAQKELKLKPIWLLASEDLEKVLGEKHGWRTLTCVAEARVDTSTAAATGGEGNVARKVRHAEKEGVTISDVPMGQLPSDEVVAEVDKRIEDWINNRKGKQVHLTDVDPWRDPEHRKYFIGRDGNGNVCALVVLAQLAPRHGYQIKWALDFPGAPGGTIEYMVLNAIKEAQDMGAKRVTFGATPAPAFEAAHNIPSFKAKALAHTYQAITKSLRLLNKSEFKQKLGAVQDAEYICYPPRGLGPMAVRAILKFFGASEDVQESASSGVRTSEDTGVASSFWTSPRSSMDAGFSSGDSTPVPTPPAHGHGGSRSHGLALFGHHDSSKERAEPPSGSVTPTSTPTANGVAASPTTKPTANGIVASPTSESGVSRENSMANSTTSTGTAKRSFFRKSVDYVRGRSASRENDAMPARSPLRQEHH